MKSPLKLLSENGSKSTVYIHQHILVKLIILHHTCLVKRMILLNLKPTVVLKKQKEAPNAIKEIRKLLIRAVIQ
jgi:hypothetical protein